MRITSRVFSELPVHDTCWSLVTGANGRVYFAACGEITGGLGAYVIEHNPDTGRHEVLVDVAEVAGQPTDSGRATQSKIHYSLVPCSDGTLYAATHCSGPPLGHPIWRPWNAWDDPVHGFPGSHLIHIDPASGSARSLGTLTPNEGCRAMALAERRGLLYGITYPRDHFFVYDLSDGVVRDLGRVGDINPQAIWTDPDENAYTTDDNGWLVRYCVSTGRLEQLPLRLPHASFREGWHTLPYDVVSAPDGASVYGSMWSFDGRLFRHVFDSKGGTIEDLGKVLGQEEADAKWDADHVGGMVFGPDGMLYLAARTTREDRHGMFLVRVSPETLDREVLDPIDDGEWHSQYISRADRDADGRLYLADVSNRPPRMYIVELDDAGAGAPRRLRTWG